MFVHLSGICFFCTPLTPPQGHFVFPCPGLLPYSRDTCFCNHLVFVTIAELPDAVQSISPSARHTFCTYLQFGVCTDFWFHRHLLTHGPGFYQGPNPLFGRMEPGGQSVGPPVSPASAMTPTPHANPSYLCGHHQCFRAQAIP